MTDYRKVISMLHADLAKAETAEYNARCALRRAEGEVERIRDLIKSTAEQAAGIARLYEKNGDGEGGPPPAV